MIYDTKSFPPKMGYWYIVDLKDFRFIVLYAVYFINKVSAKRAVRENFAPTKRSRIEIISGVKLKKYILKYRINIGRLQKFHKYDYDPKFLTPQQTKTARTKIRRRLRRIGMLVPKKHKFFLKDKVKQRRVLVNKQKVAMSPNTEARGFRLERLPKHYYHIIISKVKSDINGIMWRVKAIRYNAKSGIYRVMYMNIHNRDVIVPYLISEIWAIALKKGNYEEFKEFCHDKGIRPYKTKKKEVLQAMVQRMGK